MSITTSPTEAPLEPLPDDLDSPRAKLVFLTLSVAGPTTVAELQNALDVPKLTLLSVLDTLASRELVERTENGYVTAA
ncbi:MarR family transcriptional regulator [Salinarchaeum laminariae]|uniref:MarR family transcriptional regulator n=1 Tax=Salinarchaeum laminariae TaxID=869888 RepID=UPI0020BEA58A|nr:MarR family transcriptional regulator [Salinarchaeum laminariae]